METQDCEFLFGEKVPRDFSRRVDGWKEGKSGIFMGQVAYCDASSGEKCGYT